MKSNLRISFDFEHELWGRGLTRVAGVDEAGRGPLAGPVVAAAVVLPIAWGQAGLPKELEGLNDSKALSEARREALYDFLTGSKAVAFGIQAMDHLVIDRVNILEATHLAMNGALDLMLPSPTFALVDGLPVKSLRIPHQAVVKGDALSYSIAAASVLAKVTRDRIMKELDRQYPGYGLGLHKGYGTAQHRAALSRLGPCAIHRQSFGPVVQALGPDPVRSHIP